MLTPFPWASSLGQQPKHLVELPDLQLAGRIRLRELVPASAYDAPAKLASRNDAELIPFFLSPDFEFCLVFGTHPRLS